MMDKYVGRTFTDKHGNLWTVDAYEPDHKFPYVLSARDGVMSGGWRVTLVTLESYLRRERLMSYRTDGGQP